jgi:peroxiredoxin
MNLIRSLFVTSFVTCLVSLSIVSHAAAEAVVGKPAPEFSLKDAYGNTRTLQEFAGRIVVLEWFNPECPFVKKHYKPGAMQASQKKVTEAGGVWLTINSSAEGKQGYLTNDNAVRTESDLQLSSTSLLLDPEGTTGRAYGAKTTPHMFVIAPDGNLAYAGAIDDAATADSDDIAKAKNYVLLAFESLQKGEKPQTPFTAAYGCSVKYKS